MPIFLIISVKDEKKEIQLSKQPIVFGRSDKADITIKDESISSSHLAIKISNEGKVLVKDLESTNGSYINSNQILSSHLFISDELSFGNIRVRINEKKLTQSEAIKLTHCENTKQVTFIKLPSSEMPEMKKPSEVVKEKKEKEKEKEKEKPNKKKKLDKNEKKSSSKTERVSLTERIKKGLFKKKSTLPEAEETYSKGEMFDLEESSGETSMFQLDKPKKNKK